MILVNVQHEARLLNLKGDLEVVNGLNKAGQSIPLSLKQNITNESEVGKGHPSNLTPTLMTVAAFMWQAELN